MDPQKKLRTRIYGTGHIHKLVAWSRHSRASIRRLLRVIKRRAKSRVEQMEKNDE